LYALVLAASAATPTTSIKVDQTGYLPDAPKIAFVVSDKASGEFVVREASGGKEALKGKLSAALKDANSGDLVQMADFTALTRGGRYYLDIPGVGASWEFSIAPGVYSRAFYLSMRSFYGQRCGIAVDLGPEFPGYKHEACHLTGAWHASSGKSGSRASAGGWHDAGDYGRYVVNSGITTGTLLWTWEMFGAKTASIKLNIPESGNGTPDILNEIRWNLDWMLSMQDSDGGVWHKQTTEKFGGFVMPEKETAISYVIGTGASPFKSSCATGDFAAVTAIAARAYKPFQAEYAAKCMRAARQAWAWLDKNPDVLFRNPQGVGTGEYGDRNCADERLWAAAELYRSSGDESFHKYFLDHYVEFRSSIRAVGPQGWPNVAPLALWTYVLGKGSNAEAAAAIRGDSLRAADEIVARTADNGYRISMTERDYGWGSNSGAANYGVQLLVANALRSDKRYFQAALENLHYLLGRNTFSLSWVTQVGANAFKNPHHRPSGADDRAEPWPGLLSGGPNRSRQDPAMKKLPDLPPAKMYLDEQASYASNEVAINWNAPLVFLLAGALP
jgi:endoglucanase